MMLKASDSALAVERMGFTYIEFTMPIIFIFIDNTYIQSAVLAAISNK